MNTAALLIGMLFVATIAILVCKEINRRILRRRQLAFLRGPLREQIQFMRRQPPTAAKGPGEVVNATQPVALLRDQRASA